MPRVFIAIVAASILSGEAVAQMPCGPAAAVAAHLSSGQYGERPFATGIRASQDGHEHGCSYSSGRVPCVYIPPET